MWAPLEDVITDWAHQLQESGWTITANQKNTRGTSCRVCRAMHWWRQPLVADSKLNIQNSFSVGDGLKLSASAIRRRQQRLPHGVWNFVARSFEFRMYVERCADQSAIISDVRRATSYPGCNRSPGHSAEDVLCADGH